MSWHETDMATGIACMVTAICFFTLHATSSMKHPIWPSAPGYVRLGYFLTGGAVLYRGVDLMVLSHEATMIPPGHASYTGLAGSLALAYTTVAVVVSAIRRTHSKAFWARMRAAEALAGEGHGEALAMLSLAGWTVAPPLKGLPTADKPPIDLRARLLGRWHISPRSPFRSSSAKRDAS